GVVPVLPRVIEELPVLLVARALANHLLQRHVREPGARDQLVQLVDVGLVVLAVVQADRARGDGGIEGALLPWKRRELERAGSFCVHHESPGWKKVGRGEAATV